MPPRNMELTPLLPWLCARGAAWLLLLPPVLRKKLPTLLLLLGVPVLPGGVAMLLGDLDADRLPPDLRAMPVNSGHVAGRWALWKLMACLTAYALPTPIEMVAPLQPSMPHLGESVMSLKVGRTERGREGERTWW